MSEQTPPADEHPHEPALRREDEALRQQALGGALAKWLAPTAESRVEKIPTAEIRDRLWALPDDSDDAVLTESIRRRGIVNPLLLRHHPSGGFELVCGARRLRVAHLLLMESVPAIVRDLDDSSALLLTLFAYRERGALDDDRLAILGQRLAAAGIEGDELTSLHLQSGAMSSVAESPLLIVGTSRPITAPHFVPAPLPPLPQLGAAAVAAARGGTGVLGLVDPSPLGRSAA